MAETTSKDTERDGERENAKTRKRETDGTKYHGDTEARRPTEIDRIGRTRGSSRGSSGPFSPLAVASVSPCLRGTSESDLRVFARRVPACGTFRVLFGQFVLACSRLLITGLLSIQLH